MSFESLVYTFMTSITHVHKNSILNVCVHVHGPCVSYDVKFYSIASTTICLH